MYLKIAFQGLNKHILGFLKLLGSAGLAAGGFALLASNRTGLMDPQSVVSLLLFIQWQTFGLTVAKMGIDQVVFTSVSQDRSLFFNFRRSIFNQVIPLSVIFSFGALWIFPGIVCIIMGSTIILDTYSLLLIADFNAREKYNQSAFLNLLNYPLFFGIILLLFAFRRFEFNNVLIAFFMTSILRTIFANLSRIRPTMRSAVEAHAVYLVGIQQALNYLLFRADQLFLGIVYVKFFVPDESKYFIPIYLFLAKFPELSAGVINIAGIVILPRLSKLAGVNPAVLLENALAKYWVVYLTHCLCMLFSIYIYRNLWIGSPISWFVILPFWVHSIFIFPLNAVTYTMFSQKYLPGLTRNLAMVCLLGLTIMILLLYFNEMDFLNWVVPLQQSIFLLFAVRFGLGQRKEIYVKA